MRPVLKVLIAILGVAGFALIGIHDRLDGQFDDKVYPVLLLGRSGSGTGWRGTFFSI